ncbi:ABC transporter permease [Streptococcus macacae]|uniref:Transport permease protein n=1 Tax=Streptococcus macacae NCTC 11558 TaxID=764298 RepID=G5JZ80_9STRE|nr:ABC transporter permease [Streptococcus macacae]EHJ51535.1 ABC-2 type transporter [Streptococcus macacae NCTC 11558]SUN78330.1 putative polysaccharide ABC transporter, permease protein [Streptococcus macacae NCTC 11558]
MDFFSRKNRILLKELIKTDFKLRYQGSAIGYLWSILKPLLLFAIMYIVFVRFLPLGGDVPHWPVALLLGNVVWSFFQEATLMGMTSIVTRGDLLRKLNFSKQTIVISAISGATINFGINLLVVLVFALLNGVHFGLHWNLLLLVPLFIELLLFSTGIAFILSTLYVKYRDFGPVWEVVLQGGFYATPIIYAITFIAARNIVAAKVLLLSPISQIIQDMRYILIDPANVTIWQMINHKGIAVLPYLVPILVFFIGFAIFNHNAKKFAEIL